MKTNYRGILLTYSLNNSILGNKLIGNSYGVQLEDSSNYNIISENNMEASLFGIFVHAIYLEENKPSNNSIYHNNFIDNVIQVSTGSINVWDAACMRHLALAVEYENRCKIDEFLTKQIQRLIDVKADNKIAITYPTLGEESNLIERIRDKIENCARRYSTSENYLIVFGFSTSKRKFERGAKRHAIAFKAY